MGRCLPSEETAGVRPIIENHLEKPALVEEKEAQITQLKREISALKIAIPLLFEEKDNNETEQLHKQAS